MYYEEQVKKQVAHDLLAIEAVKLQPNDPFTWASGLLSPIYCDNRLTISYPMIRQHITKGLAKMIQHYYPEATCIAGTATAGIPHAAFVAYELNLPMVYIRSQKKDHGKCNQVEGNFYEGEKMVVIDDLISTGGSVLQAIKAAENEGASVCGAVSIFTYELEKGKENFKNAHKKVYSLTDYSTLIEVAKEEGYLTAEELDQLKEWRKNAQ